MRSARLSAASGQTRALAAWFHAIAWSRTTIAGTFDIQTGSGLPEVDAPHALNVDAKRLERVARHLVVLLLATGRYLGEGSTTLGWTRSPRG